MNLLSVISFLAPPAIAVFIIVYLKLKISEMSLANLIHAFFWGMMTIIPVLLVQLFASYLELDNLRSLRRIIFYSLVILAFFSEFSKYMVIRAIYYPKVFFSTPVDGILYSVIISMGFATTNNILYFVNIPEIQISTGNAITTGPANVVFGVLMGFFLGLGKLRKLRLVDSMTGLTAATFFHALYVFCLLTNDYKLLTAFFIGSAVIVFSLGVAAIRISVDASKEEKRA